MLTPPCSAPGARGERTLPAPPLPAVALCAALCLLGALVVAVLPGSLPAATGAVVSRGPHQVHLALDIFPVRPLGPADNWPAYTPATDLSVPAGSVVTVTIRNFDLGAAPLTPASPFARVRGTLGGASADGRPYTALDPARVAHTFTIEQLGLNVPIPASGAPGAVFVTVRFSFRAGARAATYQWRCNAPCGTGDGFEGPMRTPGYMVGTLATHACCCC
jgi:hypothetical protein